MLKRKNKFFVCIWKKNTTFARKKGIRCNEECEMKKDSFDWQGEYVRLNTGYSTAETRPLIGITGNYSQETCTLAEGYYQSVLKAGGIPMVIPPSQPDGSLAELLDRLDGIIFSGGGHLGRNAVSSNYWRGC